MAGLRKPSSPLRDALKLFFRNPSAVVALGLILLLAAAAISGSLFTGKEPTPAQLDLIENARELGDTVDLDINAWAKLNPHETTLEDKFLPPFSRSNQEKEQWQRRLIEKTPTHLHDTPEFKARLDAVEPKFYLLGTDHLGRDVLAQLWAGSTISLTIGFLAVSIAVLLGVSLGGIAGFFGRRTVRLPMLVMLLAGLIGGVAIPAEAVTAGMICFAIAIAAFIYQLVVALIGRRYRAVIVWAVVAAVVAGVFGFNTWTVASTPEGKMLEMARQMHDESHDLLLATRDLGREQKKAEAGLQDAKPEEWFVEQQLRLDIGYRRLRMREQQYELVKYVQGLEIRERLAREMLDRAAHLNEHIDPQHVGELSAEQESALSPEQQKLRTRHQGRRDSAEMLQRNGTIELAKAEAVKAIISPYLEDARSSIESALELATFANDFDFGSAEQRVNKLLETGLAIKRIDRALSMARYAESLASGLMVQGAPTPAIGAPLQEAAQEAVSELGTRINGIDERIKAIGTPADDQQSDELRGLRDQLTSAKGALEEARAAVSFAGKLKDVESSLDGKSGGEASRTQLQLLLDHTTGESPEARGVRAQLQAAWSAAQTALQGGTPPADELGKAALAQQKASLTAAAAAATSINALEDSISADKKTVAHRLEVIKQPEEERSEADKAMLESLDEFDYLKDSKARDPYHFAVEPSVKLLNRRAQLRALYVKKYEADAAVRFDGPGGMLESKMLDGSYRYGEFRITRHFITITILIVLLVVVSLFAAAAAQGAAEDIKGPLSKPFISTINVDDLVMRFTEIMLTIPTIYLILAVLALFERDVYIVMAVIGLTSWMGTTRFVRAEILSLREQDFIQAARALGVSDYRIVWRHLVPNAISPVLVSATLMVATAVLAESTLSFLGIGAGPDQPTWGQILSNGRAYITDASWLTWIPGVAILITVLSFNLLGEGLREAFNPKLRGR